VTGDVTEPITALMVITDEELLQSNVWEMGTIVQEIHTGECCDEKFCDFYQPLWEMAFQCGWTRPGHLYDPDDDSPRLPVRLLWHPDFADRNQQ
jgi:hypothetical protein